MCLSFSENPEPARTNIVFYWFQTESQDERPEDIDIRIFIPENVRLKASNWLLKLTKLFVIFSIPTFFTFLL